MNSHFLYYYPSTDAIRWGFTPGKLTFESVDRFIKGQEDYWQQEVRQAEKQKRKLVLFNWALPGYHDSELERCIEVLYNLLDQQFVIYAMEMGEVIKLTPKNLKEKLQDCDFRRGLSGLDRKALVQALALHDVASDEIGFLDYFACQQLFFGDKENRVHSRHVWRSALELEAIVASLRESTLVKPIAVLNEYNPTETYFKKFVALIPSMVEEEQITSATLASEVEAEQFLSRYTPEQFRFLEEVTFQGALKSPVTLGKILALSPNLRKLSFRGKVCFDSSDRGTEKYLYEKIDLRKLEVLNCLGFEMMPLFLAQLLSKAPNLKMLNLGLCRCFGQSFDLELDLRKLEELTCGRAMIDGFLLGRILSKAPNLKKLCLNNCKHIHECQRYYVNIHLTKLVEFEASGSTIGIGLLEQILSHGGKLEKVDLSDCQAIDGTIENVGLLWKLKSLNLANSAITPEGLGAILPQTPNLVSLNLSYCPKISGGLAANVTNLISLPYLETFDCSHSSIEYELFWQIVLAARGIKRLLMLGHKSLVSKGGIRDALPLLEELKGIEEVVSNKPTSSSSLHPSTLTPSTPCLPQESVSLPSQQIDANTAPSDSKTYATRVFMGKDGVHPHVRDHRKNIYFSLQIKERVRPGEWPFIWVNDNSFALTPCADEIHWMFDQEKTKAAWEAAKQTGYKFYFGIADIPPLHRWEPLDSLSPEETITHMCVDRTDFDICYAKRPNLYFVRNRSKETLKAFFVLKAPNPVPFEQLDVRLQELVVKYRKEFQDEGLKIESPSPTGHDYAQAIISQKRGACRHRSVGFYIEFKKMFPGIEIRGNLNSCHSNIEFQHQGRWVIGDLGGSPSNLEISETNHPHLFHREVTVSKNPTMKESIQEYFRHHIIVSGKNALVEVHTPEELRSALSIIRREHSDVYYVDEPKELPGVCEKVKVRSILVVNLSTFDVGELPQIIELTERKKLPQESCLIGLYILNGSFIPHTEEFLELFQTKLEVKFNEPLAEASPPPPPPVIELPTTPPEPEQEPVQTPPIEITIPEGPVNVEPKLKRVPAPPQPIVAQENIEARRQATRSLLERKVLETLWDVAANEDLKWTLQFDAQGEPTNFAEWVDKDVLIKGKNVHIAVHSAEELDLCTFWLQRHLDGTYYIDRPEEIRCSTKWIDSSGALKKGPGGPLYQYIRQAAQPVFIINFNTFEPDDIVLCNAIYEKDDRAAEGVPLPPDSCVIGLSVIHPKSYKGNDFKDRFYQRIELSPFAAKSPLRFEDGSKGAYPVDLFGVSDWKERFLGRWIIEGDHFVWKKGLLEEKHPHLDIQNGPWDNRDFRMLWQQELLRNPIQLSRSETLDWDQFKGIVTWIDAMPQEAVPVLINPSFLGQMELNYRIENGKLFPLPGCIEKAKNSILYAYQTSKLTDQQWYQLLKQCQAHRVELHILASDAAKMAPSGDIYICENSEAILNTLKGQDPQAVPIYVTDCDSRLYTAWDVHWVNELEFRFEKRLGSLPLLLREGKHVILWGDFSGSLLDALMPLLLQQEKFPGQLTIVAAKNEGFELFRTQVYEPLEVAKSPQIERLPPLQPMTLHPFEEERLQLIYQALNRDLHVCIEGDTGVGKTTFVRNVLAKHPDFTVFFGKEERAAWAKCRNGTIPLIFEDEINLQVQISGYEGMYQSGIVIEGTYYKLTPQHRMVSARNPESFGGERREVPFLLRHPNSIAFTPLTHAYLYDVVLHQYQLPKSTADLFLEVYQHVGQLTPRELEMMALVTRAIPNRDPRIAAYRIAKYALAKKKQPAFHDWFTGRFGKIALPTVDHDVHNFILTDSRQEAYGIVSDFLAVRKLRRETSLQGGLGGLCFEGIPRDGKSHFAVAALLAHGFIQVSPQEIGNCSQEAFCLLPANMPIAEKKECLLAAFDAGQLVIANETNASPGLESLYNALAMGFDETSKTPKKRGFGFIRTQNPIYFAGRRATTSPSKHRVLTYEFTPYGQREMSQIVLKKYPSISQEAVRLLTQKQLSFGELLNVVEKGLKADKRLVHPLPDVVEQQGPVCKLYALSAVMQWLYCQSPMHGRMEPPPARKRDRMIKAGTSLRQLAKKLAYSQVGEVYSPQFLVEIAKNYGFQSTCVVNPSREGYISMLKEMIDSEHAPIVFFDVAMKTGMPIKLGSKQEHAAICVGYFYNLKNELFFTLLHWGKPWVVKAEELADSANQLSLDREPETFHKVDRAWRQRGDRQDVEQGDFERVLGSKRVVARTGKKSQDTFRNKIIIVG